jgi:hypothetical protein
MLDSKFEETIDQNDDEEESIKFDNEDEDEDMNVDVVNN